MTAADSLLAALGAKAGGMFRHEIATTSWHSAGLPGERHELHLVFDDPATAMKLLVGLADYEFDIGDSFVADIIAGLVEADGDIVRVKIEALTLTA